MDGPYFIRYPYFVGLLVVGAGLICAKLYAWDWHGAGKFSLIFFDSGGIMNHEL